jgi:hypothetical protein
MMKSENMDNTDILYLKQQLESIDWNADFEKADKENYEALDSLCEYIEKELSNNLKSETIEAALLLLAQNVGCAEDFERYEDNFVNRLVDEGLLSKERAKLFYNNTNRRQG